VSCGMVAKYAGLASSGFLPAVDLREVSRHLTSCRDCATHLTQMATTSALIGARLKDASPSVTRPVNTAHDHEGAVADAHAMLSDLARQMDPAHADDLVQDTWDHFLGAAPTWTPRREELTAYLLQHAADHRTGDEENQGQWADSVVAHHAHSPSEAVDGDLPAGFEAYGSLRELADLDALDADADSAELLLPELYSDADDRGTWVSPPTAWPHAAQLLGPADDVQTQELYAVVDAALDELPPDVGDVLFLIDVEGLSLHDAAGTVHRDPTQLQRQLARGRNHVRGRVDAYLNGR
jgi:DNA-directed RNA polymerase specialized sigma24 family protein